VAKTIWIDLENSPHVPFFLPWIGRLRETGHEVLLTARDLSQTLELLRLENLEFTALGGHSAGSKPARAARSMGRAVGLANWARGRSIDLALSHGSRAGAMAAATLRIPALTFIDYEFVSLRAFGLCCQRVFVPEAVSVDAMVAGGVPLDRIVQYPGIKEQLYLDSDGASLHPDDPPLVLVRPPARLAHYHTAQSAALYQKLLDRLATGTPNCRVLVLPRYETDRNDLAPIAAAHPHISIAEGSESAESLLRRASLVVSGGGTMVREAAVLGIPAASFFGGRLGGVDRRLIELGRLVLLENDDDVASLALPGQAADRPERTVRPQPLPETAELRVFLEREVFSWLETR